jgi:hypothetical protein
VNESAGQKLWKKRPWKSQERFPLSHSSNNNKLDDRDHFQQNAKTSVASLRGLIGSSRNIDRHHSGMLIDFIGIPSWIRYRKSRDIEGKPKNITVSLGNGKIFISIQTEREVNQPLHPYYRDKLDPRAISSTRLPSRVLAQT